MGRLYNYVRGQEILTIREDDTIPIIEGMLNKGDYILFTAEEKVGKTIFSQQLCCALSSGQQFLGAFHVHKPCKVWYMFNEVRMTQIQERFIAMSHGVDINVENITLIPFRFRFNTPQGYEELQNIINENQDNKPDVIILDALYKAIKGTLKDDQVINEFNHRFNQFSFALGGCARIVVHHLTKPSKDESGKFHARTDKDSFGSAFLLADVDHVFRLERWGDDPKTKERILKCETQRSGDVIESVRMLLIEPDPLYYTQIDLHKELHAKLLDFLEKCPQGLSIRDILEKTHISRPHFFNIIKPLMEQRLITKTTRETYPNGKKDGRTVLYLLTKNSKSEVQNDTNL